MDTADPNKFADDIIGIAKLCTTYGVKDIIVLSVLPKHIVINKNNKITKQPVENKVSTK